MAAKSDADSRLSFFAFTATPKAKTLEMFGREDENGMPIPFDLYSMKQAIQEGFILDVLQNYTTYDLGARISRKAGAGPDEEVDAAKGTKAYIEFVELHPTNVNQKASVILDHYMTAVQPEMGGRAKAMVVTSSRAAAVKYARAFEKAIAERELPLKTLVAFSGEVPDPDIATFPGKKRPTVTENSMNPDARGRDIAEVFRQPDQNILIVANKYQTGFDQPLLAAMYVDKKLSGVAAVQTLSRLNRRAPGKTATYVLDFVNDPETILAAFKTYYEDAYLETASDPDLVADLLMKLDAVQIYTQPEVERLWKAWNAANQGKALRGRAHGAVNAALEPAVDRFTVRWANAHATGDTEEVDRLYDFRQTLAQYVKTYGFFAQLLNFGDPKYEKFSVYAEMLARKLAGIDKDSRAVPAVDVSDVVLTHYNLEKVREEDLQLAAAEEGLCGITEAGLAQIREREKAAKSDLIEKVNKYFGDLDVKDEYLVTTFETLNAELRTDPELVQQAKANTKQDFHNSPTLRRKVEDAVWTQNNTMGVVLKRLQELPWNSISELLQSSNLWEEARDQTG